MATSNDKSGKSDDDVEEEIAIEESERDLPAPTTAAAVEPELTEKTFVATTESSQIAEDPPSQG